MIGAEVPSDEFVVLNHVGPGADKAHVANQDVEELGKFIDTVFTYKPPEPEGAVVVFPSLLGICSSLFHNVHGAELDDLERFPTFSTPDLPKKYWAGGLDPLEEPDHQDHWRQYEKDDGKADREIEKALEDLVEWAFKRFVLEGEERLSAFHDGNQRDTKVISIRIVDEDPATVALAKIDDSLDPVLAPWPRNNDHPEDFFPVEILFEVVDGNEPLEIQTFPASAARSVNAGDVEASRGIVVDPFFNIAEGPGSPDQEGLPSSLVLMENPLEEIGNVIIYGNEQNP